MTRYEKTNHLPGKKLVTVTNAKSSPRATIRGTSFVQRAMHWQVIAKSFSYF